MLGRLRPSSSLALTILSFVSSACFYTCDPVIIHEVLEASFVTDVSGLELEYTPLPEGRSAMRSVEPAPTWVSLVSDDVQVDIIIPFNLAEAEVGDTATAQATINPGTDQHEGDIEIGVVAVDRNWRPRISDTLTLSFGGVLTNDGGPPRWLSGNIKLESEGEAE